MELINQDTVFNSMESTQKILTTSLLYNFPSVWIVGRNGLGKTTLLAHYAALIPKTDLVDRVEMGGLEDSNVIKFISENGFKNICLADFRRVVSRKHEVAESTVDAICNSIDNKRGRNVTYRNRKNLENKLPQLNWIIASTPQLFTQSMGKDWIRELITRCAVVFADEPTGKPAEPIFTKENINDVSLPPVVGEPTETFSDPRHSTMMYYLKNGLSVINGVGGEDITVYLLEFNRLGQYSLAPHTIPKQRIQVESLN